MGITKVTETCVTKGGKKVFFLFSDSLFITPYGMYNVRVNTSVRVNGKEIEKTHVETVCPSRRGVFYIFKLKLFI
jgi:hypothetical protein